MLGKIEMKDYQFEDMDFMASVSKGSLNINLKATFVVFFYKFWEDNSFLKYAFYTVLLMSTILQLEYYCL